VVGGACRVVSVGRRVVAAGFGLGLVVVGAAVVGAAVVGGSVVGGSAVCAGWATGVLVVEDAAVSAPATEASATGAAIGIRDLRQRALTGRPGHTGYPARHWSERIFAPQGALVTLQEP
jgi:hypothetical protein